MRILPRFWLVFVLLALLSSITAFIYFSEGRLLLTAVVVFTVVLVSWRMECALYLVAFLTPLLVRSQQLFGTEKISAAELIVLAALCVWVGGKLRQSSFRLVATPLDAPLVLFLLLTAAASVYPLRRVSFPLAGFDSASPLYPAKVLLDVFEAVLFYFFVADVFRIEHLRPLVAAFVVGLLASSIIGITQYAVYISHVKPESWFLVYDSNTVRSTLNNQNVFGMYLVLMAPLLLYLVGCYRGLRRVAILFACALVFAALLASHSRSAWVGFLASVVIVSSLREKNLFRGLVLAAVLFVVCASLLLVFKQSTFAAKIFRAQADVGERMSCYSKVFAVIAQNPIGIGAGTFRQQAVCGDYHHAHDLFLQLAVERGVFALVVFAHLVVVFLKSAASPELKDGYASAVRWGLTAGVVGVLVQGLFDYPFYSQRIALLFFFVLAVVMGVVSPAQRIAPS